MRAPSLSKPMVSSLPSYPTTWALPLTVIQIRRDSVFKNSSTSGQARRTISTCDGWTAGLAAGCCGTVGGCCCAAGGCCGAAGAVWGVGGCWEGAGSEGLGQVGCDSAGLVGSGSGCGCAGGCTGWAAGRCGGAAGCGDCATGADASSCACSSSPRSRPSTARAAAAPESSAASEATGAV